MISSNHNVCDMPGMWSHMLETTEHVCVHMCTCLLMYMCACLFNGTKEKSHYSSLVIDCRLWQFQAVTFWKENWCLQGETAVQFFGTHQSLNNPFHWAKPHQASCMGRLTPRSGDKLWQKSHSCHCQAVTLTQSKTQKHNGLQLLTLLPQQCCLVLSEDTGRNKRFVRLDSSTVLLWAKC